MKKNKFDLVQKKEKRLVASLGILVFTQLIIQAFFANSLSSFGREISHLVLTKNQFQGEEIRLGVSLASLGSLERVRREATEMGMIESYGRTDYLTPQKVAYRP